MKRLGLGLWCSTPYRGGQFYWWRKRSMRIKPPTCHKSLTNFNNVVSSTPRYNTSGDMHG